MNYFDVFELPKRLAIDTAELQRRFYALSRRWHPDYQQSAPADAQAAALEQSALVNAAYRALRDPIARVEYLVRLEEGRGTREGATVKPAAPPDLLEEVFTLQETLQEARAGGLAPASRARLAAEREALAARYRDEEARLTGELSLSWDDAAPAGRPAALGALKQALATRAYLGTVLDDLGAALKESENDHVTHRRH